MAEFIIRQSINKDGPYKWYWMIQQPSGHIYHISEGYYQLSTCVDDLVVHGEIEMKKLELNN